MVFAENPEHDFIERFFFNNHRLLTDTARQIRTDYRAAQPEIALTDDSLGKLRPIPQRRRHLFDKIKRLQASGKPLRRIARELKIARNTVRQYVRCDTVPHHHAGAGRPSLVIPFADYLEKRWREGEHNAFRLWQEMRERGFTGQVDSVQRFVHGWRKTPVGKINYPVSSRGMSPRQAAKILLNREPGSLKEKDCIRKLCAISPKVKIIRQVGNKFQPIVKEKLADLFDDWLIEVKQSSNEDYENWVAVCSPTNRQFATLSHHRRATVKLRGNQPTENDQTADVWASEFRFAEGESTLSSVKLQVLKLEFSKSRDLSIFQSFAPNFRQFHLFT